MNIIILIFCSFILIASRCTLKVDNILNYQPQAIKTAKIENIKLELSESLNLYENEEFQIINITSAEFVNNGNQFCVINGSSLAFYDTHSGKILKVHRPLAEFSDFVAKSGKLPYIDPKIIYRNEQSYFVESADYEKHGITKEMVNSFIKNRFSTVRCIDDTIYASFTSYCPFVTSKSDRVYENIPIIFKFTPDFEIIDNIVIELKLNKHAISRDFILLDDFIYFTITSQNYEFINNSDNKSIPTAAKYDIRGYYLETVSYQTENYLKKGGIQLPWVVPRFVAVDGKVMFLYPDELSVFGENKKLFDLQNLPFSNDSGFVYYQDYLRYCRSKEMKPDIEVVSRLFPIKIVDAFENDNKLYPIILIWDKSKPMGFYYLIQEYTSDGKLLREVALDDEPENQIRQFAFNKHAQELVLFKKSKHGWIAEKWSFR